MSQSSTLVPCLTWVRRGVSKSTPDKIQLDKEELRKLIEEAQDKLDEVEDNDDSQEENMEGDAADGAAAAEKKSKKQKKKGEKAKTDNMDDDDDILTKYGLDDYDDEEDAENGRWANMGNLTDFASNEDDPYITLKNDADSDQEDEEIKATDNLILCGRCQGDLSVLDVYVYNEENNQLYIHHDYLLSSFPLALEWLNFDGYENAPGNFVAIGSMDPVIEIWDLDIMESVGPTLTLGSKPKKTKKKMKQKESVLGHTQAVLDLSWNSNARHVLASASADTTVALWDLSNGKMAMNFTQHSREVQCCKWHPQEEQTLLTGSFDNTVKVVDCRNAEACHKSWSVQGEVEKAVWNHHNPLQFMACTDKGMVYCFDIRNEKPVFSLGAHSSCVTGVCLSSQIPGLMITTSEDKTMKIWDIQDDKPTHVFSRNLKMKELHCTGCCPEAPFVFAVGGGSREPKVWDIRESAAVRHQFLNRMPTKLAKECEGDENDVVDNNDDDDDAVTAMEGLEMGDEDDEGATAAAAAPVPAKKKKKKKKKAKKPE